MNDALSRIAWTLGTYGEARRAVRRQFDPDRIRAVQNARLQRLVCYCASSIKYYRELFAQAGIDPQQIRTADDLERIPFLTKEELRGRFWDFLPRDLPACRVSRTSGSTGIPVCILADWNSRKCNSAAVIRSRRAAGIPFLGRPLLTLLNTGQDLPRPPQWTFLQGVHRQYFLNPYVRSRDNVEYAARLARRLRKPALTGITSSVRTLAQAVRDGDFPPLRPALVTTGGEMLLPAVRDLIETTFGVKVLDAYACNEARDIAWQCRQARGYHVNADNLVVEIIRAGRRAAAGQAGEVVVTDLNRYVMPILRYKNGDLARWAAGECPCGCRLPMLAEIVGRTGENVTLPDGRIVLWNQLKGLMNHPQIRQFRLVQEGNGDFTVRYVPENTADVEQLERLLRDRFRILMGDTIPLRLERTTFIAPEPTGKSKLVVSHYQRPDPTSHPQNRHWC
jgi:phenylacetate-CoA ligase